MHVGKKKYRIITSILISLLLLGILAHSAVLWTLNRVFPPETLAYTTLDRISDIKLRLSARNFAEIIIGACSTGFCVGNIIMIYSFIKKGITVSFRKLFFSFFAICAAMFICVTPFAILDKAFWGDYFFPIRGLLIVMTMLLLIMVSANLTNIIKKKLIS